MVNLSIDELKINALDLQLLGYMSLGNDIKNMLNECIKEIEKGNLKNNRDELLSFLKQ